MIEQSGSSLFGPTDRARRFVTDGGLLMGMELTPVGWLILIGGDASDLANAIVPLGMQLGLSGSEIRQRLIAAPDDAARVGILDAILGTCPRSLSSYCEVAARVQQAIQSGAAHHVSDLSDQLGVEPRRLLRVCASAFGFPPVRLLRRQRFLRSLDRIQAQPDRPLGQSIDPSYYDQAHFNRDFRACMGMSPLAYFRLPHRTVGGVTVEGRLSRETARARLRHSLGADRRCVKRCGHPSRFVRAAWSCGAAGDFGGPRT